MARPTPPPTHERETETERARRRRGAEHQSQPQEPLPHARLAPKIHASAHRRVHAQGYVFGIITESGKSIAGSSDTLRRGGSTGPVSHSAPAAIDEFIQQHCEESGGTLKELSDTMLGSLLSAMMPHCDPPRAGSRWREASHRPWWPQEKKVVACQRYDQTRSSSALQKAARSEEGVEGGRAAVDYKAHGF
ncbi:ETHYLENE INSENSITIVE 3-like 2 protein [Platanthera guangdongensis]|uniref:ETHYLENE INSENSITIVE 3-like 2 protein n=1 Tax=Platanthera guangdongensis TaxID=2320717 RepID=A0ABR2MGG8_9ASPA